MEYYKMFFGDVIRMSTPDFRIPADTIEVIEFAPKKEKYKEKINNKRVLREALIASFKASSHKFLVRKWVLEEVGDLPNLMSGVKQVKKRWNIEFIKREEVVDEVVEEETFEEVFEFITEEIIEEEERSELWQQ